MIWCHYYYYTLVKQYVSAHYTILLDQLGRQKHNNIKIIGRSDMYIFKSVYFVPCSRVFIYPLV